MRSAWLKVRSSFFSLSLSSLSLSTSSQHLFSLLLLVLSMVVGVILWDNMSSWLQWGCDVATVIRG